MSDLGMDYCALGRWVGRKKSVCHGMTASTIYKFIERMLIAWKIFKALERHHGTVEMLPDASGDPFGLKWEPGFHSYFIRWKPLSDEVKE